MIFLKAIWKIIRLIALLPIYAVLKLIEWTCNLAQFLSGWMFRLLGLLMMATAVASWGFHLEMGHEVVRMLVAGLIVFLLPMLGEFIIVGIILIEFPIRQAIKN